jgi:predicted TIM-barrel fold metal-dependent hydrolase
VTTATLAGPVFDFHARLAPRPDAVAQLLATMDAVGITRAVVCAGGVVRLDQLAYQIVHGGGSECSADNAAVLTASTGSDGRLVPFFFGNPHDEHDEYARSAPEFRGLELSPAVHGVGFADPRMHRLVAVAERHGHPVYAVCVGTPGGGTAEFVALAKAFPDTTFVFGHCGFIGIDLYAIGQIAGQANIVAELSGCFSVTARAAVDQLGADRVLFGTEYPLQHPRVELAKLAGLELRPGDHAKVAWRNAHRLLKEDAP